MTKWGHISRVTRTKNVFGFKNVGEMTATSVGYLSNLGVNWDEFPTYVFYWLHISFCYTNSNYILSWRSTTENTAHQILSFYHQK